MGAKREPYEIAVETFERIRSEFPHLSMRSEVDPHVDLAMRIPAQPGLSFDVDLNLQNFDELHLVASAFWCEWFPCTDDRKTKQYLEAVSGLLSGEFRIVENWRGKRCVRARLQRPEDEGWKTVAFTSNLLSLPWPPRKVTIVQNVTRSDPAQSF